MTTFYLDFEGGNDANDGLSFANRWKTFNSGATAARIAPGDTIRIMASAAATSLGQNATWTDNNDTVTLTSAVTQNIMTGDSAFTASANVTASTSTTIKREGTASASLLFASAFTTGKAGYFATGTLDLSSYQQISFWVRATTATAANTITIKLCSDTTGDTAVDTFTIAVANVANTWHNYTLDKGSALGASIKSIGIYADIDPVTPTWYFDNIIACKAASSADSLSLRSLISKNTGSDIEWWPIASINGTTIKLNGSIGATANVNTQPYHGTTESVTTYKREMYPFHNVTTTAQAIQDSGTTTSYITFSGGWNRTDMSTQTDVTWMGGRGTGTALDFGTQGYVKLDKIYIAYWSTGYDWSSATSFGCEFADVAFSNVNTGVTIGTPRPGTIDNLNFGICTTSVIAINAGSGSVLTATGNRLIVPAIAAAYPINCVDTCSFIKLYFTGLIGGASGLHTSSGVTNYLYNARLYRALNSSVLADASSQTHLFNCSVENATEFTGAGTVYSIKHAQTADNHKIYLHDSMGTIVSATDQRHTASGISWKFLLTTDTPSVMPEKLSLGKVAVNASALVTVSLWCRRSNTGLSLGVIVPKGQISGLSSDASASMTAAANTWEQITTTFTPTEAGVVEIFAFAYGGTTYSGWVDDLSVTQA